MLMTIHNYSRSFGKMYIILLIISCLIATLLTAFLATYIYFCYKYTYWSKRNVEGPKPKFPEGNVKGIFTKSKHISEPVAEIYHRYKHAKYVGFYSIHIPVLMVRDTEYIKMILIKQFDHFNQRGQNDNFELEPLSNNIAFQNGEQWRIMRTKLSPVFTASKMKILFDTMVGLQNSLRFRLKEETSKTNLLDIKDILLDFTLEIIGSCVFGLKKPKKQFKKYALEGLFPTKYKNQFALVLSHNAPGLQSLLHISPQSEELINYFTNLIKKNIKNRYDNNITRSDFLQFMLDLNKNNNIDEKPFEVISLESIIATSFVFILGGYEASSSAASFALLELATDTECQDKAREEIKRILDENDGILTYDALQKMEYLSMVIDESFRLHPPLSHLQRKCVETCKLDDDLTIEKDTMVYIPVVGIHTDPKYYPEPFSFKPERFTKEAKNARDKFAYLPFGEGPRVCIGMRFGLLQLKISLVTILSEYRVGLAKNTLPIELDKRSIILSPEDVSLELFPLK